MSLTTLGIGELKVVAEGDSLRTVGLGSCVAIILHHPRNKVLAMAHIVMPSSETDDGMPLIGAGYFADTAILELFKEMEKLGCPPNGGHTKITLVGGARIDRRSDKFRVGKRNVLAVKKQLWRYGLTPTGEDTGGYWNRSVTVAADTGVVRVVTPTGEMSLQ